MASNAEAGDPRRVWKTIETEHFVIHYYQPLDDVAQRVAEVAEHSHQILVPVFDHEPREKTQIVVTDETDGANGFASVLPRNAIRLFATAPTALSSLNDHDDWLYGLTAHEYTHILHLDSIGGLPRLYNRIFGKTWAPNQIQPRWVIEGIATYQESKQSSGGRTRSALFDMDLRAVTLDDQRLDLDAVTNGPRTWPRGNAAYLYGSHFLEYVFDRYGQDKLRDLSWSYGTGPVPYGLNRTIKNITGRSFDELYGDWLEHLRDKYSMQLEAVERAGLRVGRRMTFSTETNVRPQYSADGKYLVWVQSDGYSDSRFRAMPTGSDASKAWDYATIDRATSYRMLADGSMILARPMSYRGNYDYNDLFRWDRRTGELKRLTFGMRAREPAPSPDESQVAFTLNGRSQTRLAVMAMRPFAEQRILWQGKRFEQADTPYWSPDGKKIAFTVWKNGGYRDLMVVDVQSGKASRITRDRATDMAPVFSPNGAYLYYSSDRNGIYNIYARDLASGKLWQVTNVVGGAFWPSISPDGKRLAYQGFGVGGYDLYELDIDPSQWIEPLPYINDRPDPVTVPRNTVAVSRPRPYRPLATLAPQSYILSLISDSFGQALNVQTTGADAVGIHSYSLSANLGLSRRDVNIAGSYTYNKLWPSFRIAVGRNASSRSGLVVDGINTRYTHDVYSLTTTIGLPVLRTARGSGRLSVTYDIDWLHNTEDLVGEYDPNDIVPRYPEVDITVTTLGIGWSYGDTRGYTYTIGAQTGQNFNASLNLSHPELGSEFRSLELRYGWEGYLSLPWGKTPSLALRLTGGVRTSDRARTSPYVLGGVPEQDIVNSVLNNLRAGTTGYLRGYPLRSVVGQKFQLANIEYRQLLWDLERGISTLPFYIRRLHLAALLDAGNAWNDGYDLSEFKVGLGGALRLDMVFGYFLPGSLEIGYARGLVNDGIGEYWLLLTGTL